MNRALTRFSEQGYCFKTGLRGWLEVSAPLGLLPGVPQAVRETLSVIEQPLADRVVSAWLRDREQEEGDMQTWCSIFEKGF